MAELAGKVHSGQWQYPLVAAKAANFDPNLASVKAGIKEQAGQADLCSLTRDLQQPAH